MRRPAGSWRSVAAWALLILVATTLPLSDVVRRTPVAWLDKLVHGVLYLVLGWLVGAAVCATGRRNSAAWLVALLGLSGFAALDEVHQLWLPARVASLGDWAADVAGATIGLTVGMILWTSARPSGRESTAGEDRQEVT